MVKLFKFYETPNTIYLLLQYASGGKLWDYVGAYLQHAQNQSKESGPGGGNHAYPNQKLQNVYTGYKIHKNENKVTPAGSLVVDNDTQETVIENLSANNFNASESKEIGKLDNQVRFSKELEDIQFDLNSDDFQFDESSDVKDNNIAVLTDLDLETSKVSETETGAISENSNTKVQYQRYTSFSSEDTEDTDVVPFSPAPLDRQNSQGLGQFQDILQKNKVPLENFSINSFDSGEGVPRIDSAGGLSDNIGVIHEVNEVICDKENTFDDSVFSDGKVPVQNNFDYISTTSNFRHSMSDNIIDHQNVDDLRKRIETKSDSDLQIQAFDNNDIIANSKELLKSVERTLSQIDGENDKVINSEVSDQDINRSVAFKDEEKSDQSEAKSEFGGFGGLSEPSIYDINRSPDTSVSHSDITSQGSSSDKSPSRPQSLEFTNTNTEEQTPLSDSTITPNSNGQKSVPHSSDVIVRSYSHSSESSLKRLNSGELSRSASSDSELKSPKSRQRTISHVFELLDLCAANPEQVRIPESFIKRWAAEIIVAVSHLHSLGIICR